MSESPAELADPEDLSKAELAARYRDLEERLTELESKAVYYEEQNQMFNHVLSRLVPDLEIEDYTEHPAQVFDELERFGKELSQAMDQAGSSRDADIIRRWEEIVDHANKLANDPNKRLNGNKVALEVQDVVNATGVSKRHAHTLIDRFGGRDNDPDKKRGAEFRPPKENPKPGGSARKKALLIDMSIWKEE